MTDLASDLKSALDRVEPVSLAEVQAATAARRHRRVWVGATGSVLAVVAACLTVVAVLTGNGTTRVTTGPNATAPAPGPTSSGPGSGVFAGNPMFDVIRSVEVPSGATGLVYGDGALFSWSNVGGQATNLVTRIDVNSGRVTATARLDASGAAFAGHLLWLTIYPDTANAPTGPGEAVALDPSTLRVIHRVPIPQEPTSGFDSGTIAAAGGLVWVVGTDVLDGIIPSTAAIVRRIPTPSPPGAVGAGGYGIDIAAPPDGSALWSAESLGGGGYDAVQVRNPNTGAVINSSTNSVLSVGSTPIAAADRYAWLAFRRGMSGSYVQVHNGPDLPATVPSNPVGGTNATFVSLAANVLWVYDLENHRTACADPTTGYVRQAANLPIGYTASLSGGQIGVLSTQTSGATTVAIAEPTPVCSGSSASPTNSAQVCASAFGARYINSAPATIGDVRSITVGPGGQPGKGAFVGLPASQTAAWCWTGTPGLFILYAVVDGHPPVRIEGIAQSQLPTPGPASIP